MFSIISPAPAPAPGPGPSCSDPEELTLLRQKITDLEGTIRQMSDQLEAKDAEVKSLYRDKLRVLLTDQQVPLQMILVHPNFYVRSDSYQSIHFLFSLISTFLVMFLSCVLYLNESVIFSFPLSYSLHQGTYDDSSTDERCNFRMALLLVIIFQRKMPNLVVANNKDKGLFIISFTLLYIRKIE